MKIKKAKQKTAKKSVLVPLSLSFVPLALLCQRARRPLVYFAVKVIQIQCMHKKLTWKSHENRTAYALLERERATE